MINIIIISYLVASVLYIILLLLVAEYGGIYTIENKIGVFGETFLATIFLPILLASNFYIWNFLDCKTNQEIEANQTISKTGTTQNKK